MSKSLRWSEAWFRRGLWLVALVFASFLIGLGSAVVDDLPQVEQRLSLDDFMEQDQALPLRNEQAALQKAQDSAVQAHEQAQLQWDQAHSNTQVARERFENWIATRSATQRSEQDPEVMARKQELEDLRRLERQAEQSLQDQAQALLNIRQQTARIDQQWQVLERAAHERLAQAQRAQELRVFLYRLALTLPLLLLAGWLFLKHRKGTWWPFVWGFIFFALFAFFVELVPYLPSYGGYVRSAVGIVVTLLIGRWAIVALQRYLERQRQAESLPAKERRTQLSYDKAWGYWSKGVCPGCERHVDLKDGVTDYCPHCGIGLFEHCHVCQARTSSFAKFCFSCGTSAERSNEENKT